MPNEYRRLETDEAARMPTYPRNPLTRLYHLHWHKPLVRLSAYGFMAISVLWLLFNSFSSGPTPFAFPPEAYEEAELAPPHVWKGRADRVKEAFLHAYHGYEHYAFPHDELRPLSNRDRDKFVVQYCVILHVS